MSAPTHSPKSAPLSDSMLIPQVSGRHPPLFDIPMEARIRPMAHLRHLPMLHRAPMDVIDMPVEVGLITDEMFPESMLPQGALVPFSAARIHPFRSIESGLAMLRDHPLDDPPTVGEILISGRQCPKGMHVVRQQHPSLDHKRRVERSVPIASRRAERTSTSVRKVWRR